MLTQDKFDKYFWTIAVLLSFTVSVILAFPLVMAVEPFGATVTPGSPETAPADAAGSDSNAFAGNVTFLDINAFSTTQSWQGYYGNVTGTIQLADSSDNVLYNWSLADPEGEIYASTNSTITWTNIQCLNFTANGSEEGIGGETAGAVNLGGMNLSKLESRFNIATDDVDGVNETFTLQHGGAGEHDEFFTANLQFSEGECISTRVFGDSGAGVANEYEEILLYEPQTASVVFAGLLEESSVLGFDDLDHDFEMLVLEDGHGTDTAATTYYFFVELE